MNKCYYRIVWKNYPDDGTPLNEQNLNKVDVAVDEMDNRIISLDATKFDKSDAQLLVKYIEYDESTGIFKITHYNGASYTIDTILEKLAINFDYDYQTQQLIIELSDGTIKYVDLSALITQYEFLDSDTVHFTISADGKVTAIVKEGSILEKHLQPNYLADIKVEVAKAEASRTAAEESERSAKVSETESNKSETAAADSAQDAADSAEIASQKAEAAAGSATAAEESSEKAEEAAEAAVGAKKGAETARVAAAGSASTAGEMAADAEISADTAKEKAAEARNYATQSKSYAVGGTDTRENENSDNAKYYYEQAKHISQGGNGLAPIGTITFEDLPTSDITTNAMYNIRNSFVSDNRFLDGGGIFYGAGNNVYYTADGFWDVLAASSVYGVKGDKETEYRQGLVNITPENVGALGKTETAADSAKWGGKKISIISETDYQALSTKSSNTIYFRYKE